MHLLYTRFFTKAMRDLNIFEETETMMQTHGRNSETLFDEPMIVLRNQGQILGAEQGGDTIVARGRWQGDKLLAGRVDVVEPGEVPPDTKWAGYTDSNTVAGEIMRRTENILQVDTGEANWRLVEVLPDAEIYIPSIAGENDVNQLRHHLEIQRMSKSRGNVVNPDELVAQYGADTVRTYLMFFSKWDQGGPWNYEGIKGPQRLMQDVWEIGQHRFTSREVDESATRALRRKTHQTIRKVTEELDEFSFNTAVAAIMELRNAILTAQRERKVDIGAWDEAVDSLLLLLAPMAPHITEELWARRGRPYSVHTQSWPVWDEAIAAEETINLVVQVNGKVRDRIDVSAGLSEDELKATALSSDKVQRWLDGKTPRKVIVVRGQLVNIVA
jgi:leucyl-tRNA synthetase